MSNLKEMQKLWTLVESAEQGKAVIKESANNEFENYSKLLDMLKEFHEETTDKLRSIDRMLRSTPYYGAAKAYWIGHILSALGNPDYPTYSTTLERTINQIKEDMHDMSDEPIDEGTIHCPSCLGEAGHTDCPSCFGTGYYA